MQQSIADRGSRDYRRSKDSFGDEVTNMTEVAKQAALAELTAEHRRLDDELRNLERRRTLTPTEQVEVSRLKKQKLLTKDRIARLS